MNTIYSLKPSFSKTVLILPVRRHLGLPSDLLPSGFSAEILYAFITSKRVLLAAALFDFVIIMIFGCFIYLRSKFLSQYFVFELLQQETVFHIF